MNEENKLRDLSSVKRWGNRYLEDAETVLQQGELKELEEFKKELAEFVNGLRGMWLQKSRFEKLKSEQQQLLEKLARQLLDLEIQIASQVIVAHRDLELLQEMDRLAFPQEIEISAKRDFSGWGKSPLYFPDNFMEDLVSARIPGGR